MTGHRTAVGVVWALTAVAVVVALLLGGPGDVLALLALVLTLGVVAGMIAQLVVGEQHGFVVRLAVTACGCLVLVLLGALVAVVAR